MAGWGGFLGKIAEQFQGRVERLKNERAKLVKEQLDLEMKPCTAEVTVRYGKIVQRIKEIDEILRNNAKD